MAKSVYRGSLWRRPLDFPSWNRRWRREQRLSPDSSSRTCWLSAKSQEIDVMRNTSVTSYYYCVVHIVSFSDFLSGFGENSLCIRKRFGNFAKKKHLWWSNICLSFPHVQIIYNKNWTTIHQNLHCACRGLSVSSHTPDS